MVKVPTTAFDPAAFIRDADDVAVYLEGLKKEGARAIALALPLIEWFLQLASLFSGGNESQAWDIAIARNML